MTKNLFGAGLAAGVAMMGLAACAAGSDDAAVTTAVATTPDTASAATPETTTPDAAETPATTPAASGEARQPLTGTPLADGEEVINRPALAVKIDNHPDARSNHTGLARADIVFEELVEGSLTRFAAVFHTQDADPIGPIRSAREQDVAILSSFNSPLFAWSGGNPGVTSLVSSSFLTDLNWQNNAGSYYRGPGASPHNLYSSSQALYALTPEDHPGPPLTQFAYVADGEAFAGESGSDVSLAIGDVDIEWNWNDEAQRYERSQAGGEHVDKTYGRVGAENVVLLGVEYRASSIDAQAPEAITVGSGIATVFSNGEYVTGTWSKQGSIYPFVLMLESGEQIELTPGQTWVELVEVASPADAPAFTLGS